MFKPTAYNRVHPPHDPVTLTKQSHADECDINHILARYDRTGIIDHTRDNPGEFVDIEPIDYHTACNIVAEANSAFAELPATLRAKFHNKPEIYLDFVHNPKNIPEMVELGMLIPQNPPTQLASPEATGALNAPLPATKASA